MLFESEAWNQLMILIGEIAVVMALVVLASALLVVIVTLYSLKSGRLYLASLLTPALVLMEGLVKAVCRLLGLDERELLQFFITIHNAVNVRAFSAIPVEKRAIFLPQCLRSARCPANLTPEGLKCVRCGQCCLGGWIPNLQALGYRVFIVPGSSFIKRMVKKYRPMGIIGVGCIAEVKEGLEMCDRMDLPAIGVVTLKEGCVETLVGWSDLCDAALLGIDSEVTAEEP
ncbi:MAG: DUF116 domain-containing protein [Methanomicrobiales archaeon]|nr:DUF116 domain-containing protein [Methanomicrobiales archaeon]MDI6876378.1 DUF116 domain-containing protein [Methanomicrobiales archaeon]